MKDIFSMIVGLGIVFSAITCVLSVINLIICIFKYGMGVPDDAMMWLFRSIGVFIVLWIIFSLLADKKG